MGATCSRCLPGQSNRAANTEAALHALQVKPEAQSVQHAGPLPADNVLVDQALKDCMRAWKLYTIRKTVKMMWDMEITDMPAGDMHRSSISHYGTERVDSLVHQIACNHFGKQAQPPDGIVDSSQSSMQTAELAVAIVKEFDPEGIVGKHLASLLRDWVSSLLAAQRPLLTEGVAAERTPSFPLLTEGVAAERTPSFPSRPEAPAPFRWKCIKPAPLQTEVPDRGKAILLTFPTTPSLCENWVQVFQPPLAPHVGEQLPRCVCTDISAM